MSSTNIAEIAVTYFKDELLCSQSILMAYAPQLNLKLEDAARIAAPFGAGMSRMGWTCGAVSGALMVIGMTYGHEIGSDYETKERMYQKSQDFMKRFEDRNSSLVCRNLLGRDLSIPAEHELAREEGLFELRCPGFVQEAAELLNEILDEA